MLHAGGNWSLIDSGNYFKRIYRRPSTAFDTNNQNRVQFLRFDLRNAIHSAINVSDATESPQNRASSAPPIWSTERIILRSSIRFGSFWYKLLSLCHFSTRPASKLRRIMTLISDRNSYFNARRSTTGKMWIFSLREKQYISLFLINGLFSANRIEVATAKLSFHRNFSSNDWTSA